MCRESESAIRNSDCIVYMVELYVVIVYCDSVVVGFFFFKQKTAYEI